jgi:hypothetical protein
MESLVKNRDFGHLGHPRPSANGGSERPKRGLEEMSGRCGELPALRFVSLRAI